MLEDKVNHPEHYQNYKKEVIEIIEYTLGVEGFKSYCEGNEIKYRLRAGDKTENWKEDIEKALWYKNARNNVKHKPDIIEQEEVDTLLNKIDNINESVLSDQDVNDLLGFDDIVTSCSNCKHQISSKFVCYLALKCKDFSEWEGV